MREDCIKTVLKHPQEVIYILAKQKLKWSLQPKLG